MRAIWRQTGNPYSTTRVVSSRSIDGGLTWSAPVPVSTSLATALVVGQTDNAIIAVWSRSSTSIEWSRSTDGGESWSAPVALTGVPAEWRQYPHIATYGTNAIVTWEAITSTTRDAVTFASTDDGASFARVTDIPTADTRPFPVRLASGPYSVVASWTHDAGSELSTTFDGGVTWTEPIVLTDEAYGPAEIETLGSLYIATIRHGVERRMWVSTDSGATWTGPREVDSSGGSASDAGVVLEEGLLTFVQLSQWGVGVSSTTDLGATWRRGGSLSQEETSKALLDGPAAVLVADAVAHEGRITAVWSERDDNGQGLIKASSVLESDRWYGSDRYATSLEISRQFSSFSGQAGSVVYIATGQNFPDALVAASAAAHRKAPLLLTLPTRLSSEAVAELRRLAPSRVIIVGATAAVSDQVKSQAAAVVGAANVLRLGGSNRYATARLVVEEAFDDLSTVYLATGRTFADALAATSPAASRGAAVMITDGLSTGLGPDARAVIGSPSVSSVYIAGSTHAISSGIETEVRSLTGPDDVTRYSGSDRYETSLLMSADAGPYGLTSYLATGTGFADALGGAALAGATGSRLLTVPTTCVPIGVLELLRGTRNVVVLGGYSVLDDRVSELLPCP